MLELHDTVTDYQPEVTQKYDKDYILLSHISP